MIDKINWLKEAFCNAKNEKERQEIDLQMRELFNQDPDLFAESMVASAKETAERATQLAMKKRIIYTDAQKNQTTRRNSLKKVAVVL